jgi:aryl-alcohol dehydrogenase-like predicted oxidoreductase
MKEIEPMLDVLSDIARARGTSMSAIALNYKIIKGAMLTVGVRNPERAQQNVAALGWRISDEEVRRIVV